MAKSSSADPVTSYAERVVSGDVVAGPHVRAACRRHLKDLETGSERGLSWDLAAVERVLRFFSTVLTVEIEAEEDGETVSQVVPFELHESQAFVVGSLFGWKNANGHRRFRRAYIEEAKGNGKSPLAAGIGHYMLTATKKLRAEVYSAATDKDQAAILFRDAVEMWRRSPALRKRLIPSGANPVWQLTMMETASFFKPISSEKRGKSGIRPYCALIDEIHEHPDNSVIEMLRAGTKGNQQALLLEITNSGADKTSVCWDEHEYAVNVADGTLENDSFFSYVCALDETDDPFEDEGCWPKANPLLGVSIHPEFIREQVREARGMPSKEGFVRRLHFCQWTEGSEGWLPRELWEACEHDLKLEDYLGEKCWLGLDLSYTSDLSALAAVFEPEPERYDAFLWFWKPRGGLARAIKLDRVPYDQWANNGYLELTDGEVIRLEPIGRKLADIQGRTALQVVAYDRYRHKELQDNLADMGVDVPMEEHPQGFRRMEKSPLWMPDSVQQLENAIVEGRLRVCYNPILRWNVASVEIRQDPAGTDNKIFDKRRSRARIDGAVALAQAIGALRSRPGTKSYWPEEKIVSL